MNKLRIFLVFAALAVSMGCMAGFRIDGLKVEYMSTPLGVDIFVPRFSWQMLSDKRGECQAAYRIAVEDESGEEVWNTGRVDSDVSLGIEYGGQTLCPSTRYTWTLTVWNRSGEEAVSSSWFETGLMSSSDEDAAWAGARWIGGGKDAMPFYSDYLPVFRIVYAVTLDRESRSCRAGFIYGANDPRLMDKNKNILPIGGGFGGVLWQSVGIVMPWQSYAQYNDLYALKAHYPAMKRYMEMVLDKYIDREEKYYKATGSPLDLGDWLGFEVEKNDNSLLFDCYFAYELELMHKMASALGYDDEAARYERIRQERIDFINAHYIDPGTCRTVGAGFGEEVASPMGGKFGPKRKGVLIDTQTSYALPLAMGIVKDEYKPRFVSNFIRSVERQSMGDDGKTYPARSLMTGFIGTAWISLALSDCGHSDEAYRMLLNREFPSWLYPVTQGATSIWERLNSMTREDGFGGNNSMNSFNHYAFGSVTNWLMQRSVGIARDERSPGFKHFILRPEADRTGGLAFARGTYRSMYGLIESEWNRDSSGIRYRFTVPANTSATVYLPAKDVESVEEGGKRLKELPEIKSVSASGGRLVLEIPSGQYDFVVKE